MSVFLGELLIQKFNVLNIEFKNNCEILRLLEALSDYQDELLTMNAMHETISDLYEDYKFEKYRYNSNMIKLKYMMKLKNKFIFQSTSKVAYFYRKRLFGIFNKN